MIDKKFPISISLAIPVYNNKQTAIPLVKKINLLIGKTCRRYEILIADDKSTDGTTELLKQNFLNKKNIKVFLNKKNVGIAKNIMSLYKKARYEYIVLFSVDGDWNPKDIKGLIEKAYVGNSDMVIGKRDTSVYSLYRRTVSFFYNFLPVLFFGINTIDAGSIKIFRSYLIKRIPLSSKSVFFEAELIIKVKRYGYKIASIPISFHRKDKKTGSGGKIKLILQSLKDLINLLFTL